MTTRQHLIENDCMDRLGWTVQQVAKATESQMIDALAAHAKEKSRKERQPATSEAQPCAPSNSSSIHDDASTAHFAALLPLQEILRMKTEYLSSTAQVLPDDADRLGQSIRADQARIDELRAQLERMCTAKSTELSQRQQVLQLLESTDRRLRRDEDVKHMRALREQIDVLQQTLRDLRKCAARGAETKTNK